MPASHQSPSAPATLSPRRVVALSDLDARMSKKNRDALQRNLRQEQLDSESIPESVSLTIVNSGCLKNMLRSSVSLSW